MADNQETPDVSARDIAELLGRFDATLGDFGKRLEAIEAQAGSNGEQLTNVVGRLDTQRDALVQVHTMTTEMHETVKEAAPLLQSRAAKALRAGGTVLDYIKAGRTGG